MHELWWAPQADRRTVDEGHKAIRSLPLWPSSEAILDKAQTKAQNLDEVLKQWSVVRIWEHCIDEARRPAEIRRMPLVLSFSQSFEDVMSGKTFWSSSEQRNVGLWPQKPHMYAFHALVAKVDHPAGSAEGAIAKYHRVLETGSSESAKSP